MNKPQPYAPPVKPEMLNPIDKAWVDSEADRKNPYTSDRTIAFAKGNGVDVSDCFTPHEIAH